MNDLPQDLLTASEACKLIPGKNGKCLHLRSLHRWIGNGKLTGWRLAGRVYVSRAALLALFQQVRAARQAELPTPETMKARREWLKELLRRKANGRQPPTPAA